MNSKFKTCQYCRKEISQDAIKCPYCQEWLNKFQLNFKNPWFSSFLFVLLMIFISFGLRKFVADKLTHNFRNPESFSKTSQLFITQHHLQKKQKSFSVIGEVENRENFKWESVTILIVFKDKNNSISSLGSGYVHNLDAGSKKPFEVSVGCSEEPYDDNKYANYDIQIDEAKGEWRVNK